MMLLHLRLLVRNIEAQCASAIGRIERVASVAEVVRASDISVSGHLRMLVRPSISRVTAAAERKLDKQLDAQEAALAVLPVNERLQRVGRLRLEWAGLAGRFPRQAHRGAQILQRNSNSSIPE